MGFNSGFKGLISFDTTNVYSSGVTAVHCFEPSEYETDPTVMFWHYYSMWPYKVGKGSVRWNLHCLLSTRTSVEVNRI